MSRSDLRVTRFAVAFPFAPCLALAVALTWGPLSTAIAQTALPSLIASNAQLSNQAAGNPSTNSPLLGDLYRQALSHDASFAAARAAYTAALERVPQAQAALRPSVDVRASQTFAYTDVNNGVLSRSGNSDSTSASLQLVQPIYRVNNPRNVAQAQLQIARAEVELAVARQDLAISVAEAWFGILTAKETLRFIAAQKQAIAEQLAAARRNFEVGASTITDTHEAQARFDLVVAQELAAQGDLQNRLKFLEQLVGQAVIPEQQLAQPVRLPDPQPREVTAWVDQAESEALPVQAALLGLDIARIEARKAQSGKSPSVDLVAGLSRTHSTGHTTNSSVAVQFSMPLYDGGLTASRSRETAALEEQAIQRLEAARRNSGRSAREAWQAVLTGLAQVQALEAAEVSSRSALEANRLGYQVGVRINIDVLNAQQQLFQTQRDLARARYDTLLAGLRLKAATGSLSEEDLDAVGRLFTP